MILAVCADKGAPGVSTCAAALSVMWPGERVLLEADPSGGDLALRLRSPHGGELALARSVTSLAADAREALPAHALARYAQPTSLGFPVLIAPLSAEGFEPMAGLWPQVAAAAQAWPGTVIADLGRLQLRHASSPLAVAASAVLLVSRARTREDLYHLRERAHELAARLGQGQHGCSPLVVAVICPARDARSAVSQVRQALASQAGTSTVPVIGSLAEDRRGVQGLRSGELSKRLLGSDLLRSAITLAQALTGWFPQLVGMPARPVVPGSSGSAPQRYVGSWRRSGSGTDGERYRAQFGSAAGASPGGAT